MANSLSASFPEYWSRRMQMKHNKTDVFRAIVSMEEEAKLKNGDTVHRVYRSSLRGQNYSRGSTFSVQDITNTDESLTVTSAKIVPFYVDDLDALQSNYREANQYADDAAVVLGNLIDGDVLGEYASASLSVDDGDFGGTAGNGVTLATTNVLRMFTAANKKLNAQNIEKDGRFAVISPQVEAVLLEYLAGRESILGDSIGQNGHIGKFYGFDLYVSNNLGWSGKLLVGTNPTANDTVTINGVTFTFVASIGSTAGNVLIGADATASITNLVTLINAPGSTTATGVALSTANQAKLDNVTATAVAGGLTVAGKGVSYVAVSETLTASGDVWTAALQVQHNLFGRKGAIDLVIQQRPNVEIKDVPNQLGKNIAPWTLYGLKTFNEGASSMVDVKVRADAF